MLTYDNSQAEAYQNISTLLQEFSLDCRENNGEMDSFYMKLGYHVQIVPLVPLEILLDDFERENWGHLPSCLKTNPADYFCFRPSIPSFTVKHSRIIRAQWKPEKGPPTSSQGDDCV